MWLLENLHLLFLVPLSLFLPCFKTENYFINLSFSLFDNFTMMVRIQHEQQKSDTNHTISVHSSSSFSPFFLLYLPSAFGQQESTARWSMAEREWSSQGCRLRVQKQVPERGCMHRWQLHCLTYISSRDRIISASQLESQDFLFLNSWHSFPSIWCVIVFIPLRKEYYFFFFFLHF